MENEHQIKGVISKHISAMFEELASLDDPCGWIPDNSTRIVTNAVYSVLEYSADVERYLESQDMLK